MAKERSMDYVDLDEGVKRRLFEAARRLAIIRTTTARQSKEHCERLKIMQS